MTTFTRKALSVVSLALLLVFSSASFSQTFTAKKVSMVPNSKGFYEYLPEGYASGSGYPLIIFVHGMGELGNGTSQLSKVARIALPQVINSGRFPKSFTVNGVTSRFVVLAPQFIVWPSNMDVNKIIDYAVKTYKIDQNRIYLTGPSMGGAATWEYAGDPAGYGKRLAGIVPICGASWPEVNRAYRIADLKIGVWATHNSGDPMAPVSYTNDYIKHILKRNPSGTTKKTVFAAKGHDAWTKTYDPNYRENGKNIYEFLLQFKKGGGTVPPAIPNAPSANKAPVANAGSNISLTLPNNAVTLDGSKSTDADGSISSYSWAKTAGPANFTIANHLSSKPIISALVAGVYTIRLTVTDNKGATATANVTVNVAAAPSTGSTLKVNAGKDVTIRYPVNYYILKGSATGGPSIHYSWKKVSGGPVNIVTPSYSKTNIIWMRPGTYVFELIANDSRNRNILVRDRITVKILNSNGTAAASTDDDVAVTTVDELTAETVISGATIFPNPVDQQFQVSVDNEYAGKMQIAIVDGTGRTLQSTELVKGAGRVTKTISLVPTIRTGIYFVRLQSGKEVKTLKLMKK